MKPSPPYVVESDLELREKIAGVIDPHSWLLWRDEDSHMVSDRLAGQARVRADSLAKADSILSLISAARKGQDGWVLVPQEPTDEALRAILHACGVTAAELADAVLNIDGSETRRVGTEIYRAMISARKGQGIEGEVSCTETASSASPALPIGESQAGELPPALLGALAEVARYQGQNRLYWWRRTSMAKLAERGLVETYTPPSMIHSRGKERPYRVTAAGVALLSSEASPLGAEPGSNANDRGREELKPLTNQPPIRERQAEGGETP